MMDISALRERGAPSAMTVGELNEFIKKLIDSNRTLSSVTVKGEISNFINHRSGHLYFTLKDADSQLRSVMFRSSAARLKFIPENGMRVIAHGAVSVYQRDGSYQLYVSSLQPDGVGALYLAYEQLKRRLEDEGLFDASFKRALPVYPRNIGIITSPTGAAVRDMINVCGRRFPLASLHVYPALVQGDGAESDLVKALDYFEAAGNVDVIIIGRGGGSLEDLWPFNGERLARRMFSMTTPIISAVGHETDFTICDFVADLRAPTPSAAAELAVPDRRELIQELDSKALRLETALKRIAERRRASFELVRDKLSAAAIAFVGSKRAFLDESYDAMIKAMSTAARERRARLEVCAEKLNVLSPLHVLGRGYAIAIHEHATVKTVKALKPSDRVRLYFSDGYVEGVIDKISEETENG